jgi:DNA polymerase III subunit beta
LVAVKYYTKQLDISYNIFLNTHIMAYVSFNQKDLAKTLANCNMISPRKSEIDLFTYTKFEINKDSATLTSINSVVYFRTGLQFGRTDIKGKDTVEFLVKTDLIANAVGLMGDDMITIEIDLEKHTLVVQGANSKHTLRIDTDGLKDFVIPTRSEEDIKARIKVSTESILEANRVAQTSVGNPKVVYQPEFLHICYTLDKAQNRLTVVSTDRHRMGLTHVQAVYLSYNGEEDETINHLINPKNLSLIANSVVAETDIEMEFGKDFLTVFVGVNELTMRYGEGKFPDYEKIIPSSFSCSFRVDSKETLQALKQVYFSARTNVINKNVSITVSPQEKKLILISKTDDGNSSESTVSMENYEGVSEDWTQSFNSDYLIDYIGTVQTDIVLWEANPGKPSVLSPEGQRATKFCLISGLR